MISICTPTYNREHTIPQVFNSLLSQTEKEFEWIVIDDGSIDGTKELIEKYKYMADFNIQYRYQTNQGKHMALNLGQEIANFDLFLCLDSDDWLVKDAVHTILMDYDKYIKNNISLAGMIYLDKFKNGEILGDSLPNLDEINWLDLIYEHKSKGDKCYVFKTDILRKYPFPNFSNNKHMPPTYQFYLISENFNMFTINKALKVVEYLDDGLSRNIKRKYFSDADNYAFYRKTIHDIIPLKKYRIKNILLYNISYLYAKDKKSLGFKYKKNQLLSYLLFPLSLLIIGYLNLIRR